MPLTNPSPTELLMRAKQTLGQVFRSLRDVNGYHVQVMALSDEDGNQIGAQDVPLPVAIGHRLISPTLFAGPQAIYLFSLTLDGLGADDKMEKDGSITPVNFDYIVPPNKELLFRSVVIEGEETGAGPVDLDNWGAGAALANGLDCNFIDTDGTTVLGPIGSVRDNHRFKGEGLTVKRGYVEGGSVKTKFQIEFGVSHLLLEGPAVRLTAGQIVRCAVQDALDVGSRPTLNSLKSLVLGTLRDV